jgi:IS1 family transposase
LRCGTTFSDSQPLDGLTIEHGKVVQIVKLLVEGVGIRGCARLVDCDAHTVLKVLETVGEKCQQLHDRLARNVKTESLQLDEIWNRVAISQKRAIPTEDQRGDFYTYLGIAAREKFIVSFHTAKRAYWSTDDFVKDLAARLADHVQITTDSYRPYQSVIRRHLQGKADYATMQKIYATPLNTGSDAWRRYGPPKCTGVKIRIQAGLPNTAKISTSFVERANLSVRHFNKRFARLGLGWSRKLQNHKHAISLFVAAHNFCKVHSTLKTTPAQAIGLTQDTWTIERLIIEASSNTDATNYTTATI